MSRLTNFKVAGVGVIGGGTMGAGIAVAALNAGLQVVMVEQDQPALDRGKANVDKVFAGQVAKGRMTPEKREEVLSRLTTTLDYADLATVDMAIEAVFEDLTVKQAVFAKLDAVCHATAILATNTSYLDINEIAASTARPQQVVGLHFFSPAHVMPLLEIVVASRTDADTEARSFAFAGQLGKVAVRAGVCDGFIGNRILAVYRAAADHMMEDGASPYQIDRALREFGFAMGPYQVSDLAGGDIGWATRKRRATTRNPQARYVQIPDRLCERGWFGQKTGRGYYLYPEGSRTGIEDPEVLAIIDLERARAGITPRTFSNAEIVRRYLAAMINEGANVVREGIALSPRDIDTTFLHGYGFPRDKGGPMRYADTVGLDHILADIQAFAKDDPQFWQPSPFLLELVQRSASFDSFNPLLERTHA